MSALEERFLQMWTARYPDIEFEREVRGIAGRQYRYDFANTQSKVALECQGGVWRASGKSAHTGGSAVERDCEKACLSHLNGWTVFPLTEKLMKRPEMLDAIADFIRARLREKEVKP